MLLSRFLCLTGLLSSILPLSLAASTPAAAPAFSVATGTYQNPQAVTISDATVGVTIYYTVTGVTPTTESSVYTGPLTVSKSMTLSAIAAVAGGTASPVTSAVYTIPPSATPTLSVAAGTYQNPQTVTMSDATAGASIYYTVTGVTPTVYSTKYTGPITVNSSMTLQAIAAVPGGPVSPIASAAYTITPSSTPTFSVPGGTYQVFKSVTMSDTTPGASIYYTVTGVTPTTMSALYTGPVSVSSNMTLQAIAAVPGGPTSPIASASYTFVPAAAPSVSVAAGSYLGTQAVTISDATSGAQIFYTVTGVTPTTKSTLYTAPVMVSSSMTLSAIAAIPGGPPSAVTSAAYTITPIATPTFSIGGGTYQVFKSVSISDTTPGTSIYYTVNGVTPTTGSTLYVGPVSVNSNTTLQALAVAADGSSSPVASATYIFSPAAAPALSLTAGSYQGSQTVTISDATSAAQIFYTVTGVTPTTQSQLYTGPITVSNSMTLSAIAAISGGPVSPITTAAYTIVPAGAPTFSVSGGTYQAFTSVAISDASAGASIYYTVTGVTPTTQSTLYTAPVSVNRNMTLEAIAALPGGGVSAVSSATYTFVPAVAPTLSVAAGSYQSPQTVTISDATSGAQIYYTVTGVTPTTQSQLYTGPITVSNSMTLSAIAAISGGPVSPITTAAYTIVPAGAPTFSVSGGTYQAFTSVAISDASAGASIYYTVTGVTPTTQSTLYTAPVSVNRNMTLEAIAAEPGGPVSPISSATYVFVPAAAPTLSVAAGSYQSPQTVTISDATTGAQIYYTVTGVTPTTLSQLYTGPITVSSNMTLSAIAAIPGGPASPVASASYTILPAATPTFSESTGVYQGIQSVAISDTTPGASIYYTVTGVTPTVSSTVYTGPVTVSSNMTLQAIAAVPDGPASAIAIAAYTIVPPSTPIATPNSSATFYAMSIDLLLEGTPWPELPISTIRLWDTGTKWGDLNPTQNTYQWKNLDQLVNMAEANNSELLYTFGGVPPWALPTNVPIISIARSGGIVSVTTATPHGMYYDPTQASTSQETFSVAGVSDTSYNGTFFLTGTPSADTLTYAQAGANSSSSSGTVSAVCSGEYAPGMCAQAPVSLAVWDEYVTQLMSHLGAGAIQYWELWNEANDPLYWQGDPKMLVAMAQDAKTIIKGVDPAAVILSPSVTGVYETADECTGSVPYCGTTWLSTWMAAGGNGTIDVVAFHAYPGIGMNPEEIQGSVYQLQAAMNRNGVGPLPIWDTESSWRNNTNLPAASDQASWLARHFLLEESIGIQRTFWYAYDAPTWGTLWTSTSGLDLAGEAYGQVEKWLTGATINQPCAAVPANQTTFVCSYTRPNGYVAQAVWNTAGAASYAVPSQFVQYHDLTGAVTPVSGGMVEISTSPILLESSSAF